MDGITLDSAAEGTAEHRRLRSTLNGPPHTITDRTEQWVKIRDIPFVVTEWEDIAPIEHPGEAGTAIWRTQQFGDIRV